MTDQEEKDLAQIERDIIAAGIAKSEKRIFEDELRHAENNWLQQADRLAKAIDQCNNIIQGTEGQQNE